MSVIKFDTNDLKLLSLFEKVTKVRPNDCITEDGQITFITPEKTAAKAVGKKGKNILNLKTQLKKDVKIIEFSADPLQLTRNALHPLDIESIELDQETNIINVKLKTARNRRILLSNNLKKLKELKALIQRYNKEVTDIKILQ